MCRHHHVLPAQRLVGAGQQSRHVRRCGGLLRQQGPDPDRIGQLLRPFRPERGQVVPRGRQQRVGRRLPEPELRDPPGEAVRPGRGPGHVRLAEIRARHEPDPCSAGRYGHLRRVERGQDGVEIELRDRQVVEDHPASHGKAARLGGGGGAAPQDRARRGASLGLRREQQIVLPVLQPWPTTAPQLQEQAAFVPNGVGEVEPLQVAGGPRRVQPHGLELRRDVRGGGLEPRARRAPPTHAVVGDDPHTLRHVRRRDGGRRLVQPRIGVRPGARRPAVARHDQQEGGSEQDSVHGSPVRDRMTSLWGGAPVPPKVPGAP